MRPSAQEKPHCPLWCSLRSYAASHFQHCRCICESEAYMDAQEENTDPVFLWRGFPSGSDDEESAQYPGSIPVLGGFPWRRKWLPTPVFLPGEFHGQRSLAGGSRKELDRSAQNLWTQNCQITS